MPQEISYQEFCRLYVKEAMKINYFDDIDLIQEQAKRFGTEA